MDVLRQGRIKTDTCQDQEKGIETSMMVTEEDMIEVENILQGDVLQDTIPLLEEVQLGDLLLLATKEDQREDL